MRSGLGPLRLFDQAMREAQARFGPPRDWDRRVVRVWVTARVRELQDGRRPDDGKARQVGDDD